jgi:putative ABC transport system permease protein
VSLRTLVVRHVVSHPVRSLLTVGAVLVASFLFCFLRSIVTTLEAAVTASASNRVITGSAVSLFQALPSSYRETIAAIDGVESVSRFTWFGGVYRDSEGLFAQFAADARTLLDQYPEVVIAEDQKRAWFEDRQGAIIGIALAEQYGWKVGDTVPLVGTIYPRVDGKEWTFNVRGIYRSTAQNVDELTMYFHFEYLDEVRQRGDAYGPMGTSVFLIRVEPGARPEDVIAAVDAHYEGGPQRTRTQTEAAFQAGFITMLGNVPTFLGMIGAAVLVALLFGVVNTMTLAARERTKTSGILKSLGFPDRVPARLYLFESMAIVGPGCLAGIVLSLGTQEGVRRVLGTLVPMYVVEAETVVLAALVCLAIAIVGGAVPAWRALRLRPVESLRGTA